MKSLFNKEIYKYFQYLRLLKPISLRLLMNDLFEIHNPVYSNNFHIQKGINWIINAQKITSDGGISCGYSLLDGWLLSYPETSGYILPTLFEYYSFTKNFIVYKVCQNIANWLRSIQLENGGFRGSTVNKNTHTPIIFNTGQIIFGLLNAYKKLKEDNFLDSAIKAGDFLLRNQEQDGNWKKYCFQNSFHTYNVRTAWALLELFQTTRTRKYKEAAIKNLNWALKQKNENYWFHHNDPIHIERPFLHFVCYTIRGFLESGLILNKNDYLQVAFHSSEQLLEYYIKNGWLPARFNSNWEKIDSYSCLTGNAQLSIIWLKIYKVFKDKRFLTNAIKLNKYLKANQVISQRFKEIDGAIKGSDPIWGKYFAFKFPNWATKFFCDALILEEKISSN